MLPNPEETADLVTFTEEILNRKLHFCAVLFCVKPVTLTIVSDRITGIGCCYISLLLSSIMREKERGGVSIVIFK